MLVGGVVHFQGKPCSRSTCCVDPSQGGAGGPEQEQGDIPVSLHPNMPTAFPAQMITARAASVLGPDLFPRNPAVSCVLALYLSYGGLT